MSGRDDDFWQAIEAAALTAGLDVSKFAEQHHAIVAHIGDFLQTEQQSRDPDLQPTFLESLKRRFSGVATQVNEAAPPRPLILVGEPGTGKTTFLYVLDAALRSHFGLPDNVAARMEKADGRSHSVQKRHFCGEVLSLLSVRKWAELLHFFAWDVAVHGWNSAELSHFINTTLTPMRIIFADEVEMTGYSPTIPSLAKHGLLVIGTSNQTAFPQLAQQAIQPRIYEFGGADMRFGDPDDAVVHSDAPAWHTFDTLLGHSVQRWEGLRHRAMQLHDATYLLLEFDQLLSAPFLESQWLMLMQAAFNQSAAAPTPLNPSSPFILLLEDFDLGALVANYDAIIRFVALFDAIEQIGTGVLVRNSAQVPTLSRNALRDMKTTIWNATGVPDDIKRKAVVGIDRLTSRIGQAGHKAKATIESLP